MTVPPNLSQYPCADYFNSSWVDAGLWEEESQNMLILPFSDIVEHLKTGFLEVGRPGVDGILFGYRANLPGVWAYYPIDQEFELKANSIAELVSGWLSGHITV